MKLPLFRLLSLACVLVFTGLQCRSYFSRYATQSYAGDDERVVRMTDNFLGGSFELPGALGVYSAQLNLQKAILSFTGADGRRSEESVISFYARIHELDYAEIKAGESLILTIDGRQFRLTSQSGSEKLRKPYSEEPDERLITETAYWHHVPEPVLRELLKASRLDIKILGAKRELNYFATDGNLANFRRFIETELGMEKE